MKRQKLFDILQDLCIDEKDIKLLKNLYWEKAGCMRVMDKFENYKEIKKGIHLE